MKPLAIDLFCGLGGWTEGLQAEGFRVVGFDIERHRYGEAKYPAQLVLQDVLTIHGRQFKDAALIVASPPCQEYSYMAMPWSIAKQKARDYESGVRDVKQLTALFDACFRIQREACEASGRYIPLVVENVRGAQKWVGRSRYHFGSFHLWGDVPALMPSPAGFRVQTGATNISAQFIRCTYSSASAEELTTGQSAGSVLTIQQVSGYKQPGISGRRTNGKGDRWFQDGAAKAGSKSAARKSASAHIAKIPFVLACWVARAWKPQEAA